MSARLSEGGGDAIAIWAMSKWKVRFVQWCFPKRDNCFLHLTKLHLNKNVLKAPKSDMGAILYDSRQIGWSWF